MRFSPSLRVVCLFPALLGLAAALTSIPAQACSPPSTPRLFYTLMDSRPAEGEALFVDGAVLLTSHGWMTEGEYSESFSSVLTVVVTDAESGVDVPGSLQEWWGEPSGVVWRPQASLLPGRRFALVATLGQDAPRPAEAQGPSELRRTFVSRAQAAPPLALLGEVDIHLEAFETDRLECTPGLCGCDSVGRETSTRARIRVPAIQGGALPGNYRVEFWVTDETPYRFDAPDQHLEHEVLWGMWGVSSSGAATETVFELPRHDEGYVPCFAYRVVDPAGNTREGTPRCMEDEIDPPGNEGRLGCAAGPGGRGALGLTLLLLGAAAALRRRR